LQKQSDCFWASHSTGQLAARTVLLTTGLVDAAPEIEGLEKAVADGLNRYCPVCDAFEATDRTIAVIGGHSAVSKAKFLRDYSKDVTLIWSGEGPSPNVEDLKKAGIKFIRRFAGFEICENKICSVTADARGSFDILYPALGCKVESNLAADLGGR
jgi:thioredoxin reductase (NADPH)